MADAGSVREGRNPGRVERWRALKDRFSALQTLSIGPCNQVVEIQSQDRVDHEDVILLNNDVADLAKKADEIRLNY